MNVLHLIWIVPAAASFGAMTMALLKTAAQTDEAMEAARRRAEDRRED